MKQHGALKMDHAVEQEDLKYFEASEDADEEFYAGGGQFRRHGLEHFPQLWCANGTYSVYGQVIKPDPLELLTLSL